MPKILVSIDDELLAHVDREARGAGLSRSAYLRQLVARQLGLARGPGRDPRVRRALTSLERLVREQGVREEATAAIRAERDAR
jgi:metal-responsive CopG/Arc/MetJ family transcriptional regulator